MKYGITVACDGERVVHNFPLQEGRDFSVAGWRYWAESAEGRSPRERCFCPWTDTAPEHYSTHRAVRLTAEKRRRYMAELERLAAMTPEDYARELLEAGEPEIKMVKHVRSRYGLGLQDAFGIVHGVRTAT